MLSLLWDLPWRRGYKFDVITFLSEDVLDGVRHLLDQLGVPFANLWAEDVDALISTGEFIDIIDAKITEKFFIDKEHRQVFRWVRKHWATYGTGPTSQAVLPGEADVQAGRGHAGADGLLHRGGAAAVLLRRDGEAHQGRPDELGQQVGEVDMPEVMAIFSEARQDVQMSVSVMREYNLTSGAGFDKLHDRT